MIGDAPDPADRRSDARREVDKPASIVFGTDLDVVPCVIRDISAGGARLSFDSIEGIPDLFDIVIPVDKMRVSARVAWRRPGMIGVSFTSLWTNLRRAG